VWKRLKSLIALSGGVTSREGLGAGLTAKCDFFALLPWEFTKHINLSGSHVGSMCLSSMTSQRGAQEADGREPCEVSMSPVRPGPANSPQCIFTGGLELLAVSDSTTYPCNSQKSGDR